MIHFAPVITIDGLSGAGKGSVGLLLAQRLGWHFLDSGAFYRLLALEATQRNIQLEDKIQLAQLASHIQPDFEVALAPTLRLIIRWKGKEVTSEIRQEECAIQASKISSYPEVRAALLEPQRSFRKAPGLVADGRDMGSIVFPDAFCKFFLTASAEVRAQRRYLQLKQQGNYASLSELKSIILQRDKQDQARPIAPLKIEPDACIIDTTHLSIQQVVATIEEKLSILKHNKI